MKRLLSILLALMLMLSMAATAFAAETGSKDITLATEAWLTKTYNDPVGRAATFSFTVTPKGKNSPTLTIADISYTAADKGGNKSSHLEFSNLSVGEFTYTVTENQTVNPALTDPTRQHMTMSQAEYEVTVSIARQNGALVITLVTVTQISNPDNPSQNGKKVNAGDPGEGNANGFNFVNTYAQVAGPDDLTLGSLMINKTVVNPNDDTKEFPFTLSFTYPEGGNPFTPSIKHSGGDRIALNPTGTTFTLKNGENVVITGLPVGTRVNVAELSSEGYTPSANYIVDGNKTAQHAELGEGITIPQFALGDAENSVRVTNTRFVATPTGVILNVLPYVLMVAIAGGMIVLFTAMKRRKAEDYEN